MNISLRLPARMVLLRHALSESNRLKGGKAFADLHASAKLAQFADRDIPLVDEGRRQGDLTGEAFADQKFHFDGIIDSGFRRTIETRERIVQVYTKRGLLIPPVFSLYQWLRERDVAYNFAMTAEESQKHFPWLQKYWDREGPLFGRPPGGESMLDVVQRCSYFLTNILPLLNVTEPLIVSHGGTIRCLRSLIEGWDIDTFEAALENRDNPPNCGYVVYENGRLISGTYCTHY
jgi:broad specificity phosphatase PhoE